MDGGNFGVEPGAARGNFGGIWFFVDATFAARLPLEMFDGVGYVNFFAIDAGFDERVIEQLPCGTDEGFAGEVFLIARLLANEHEFAVRGTFAENRLRAELPEVAVFAGFSGFA
jgi:hypothetical protein